MCGIAGFYHPHRNYLNEEARYRDILKDMAAVQRHRGPDDSGVFLNRHAGLSHARQNRVPVRIILRIVIMRVGVDHLHGKSIAYFWRGQIPQCR